jgi:hypothetical protein
MKSDVDENAMANFNSTGNEVYRVQQKAKSSNLL